MHNSSFHLFLPRFNRSCPARTTLITSGGVQEATEREMKAVDSENSKNLQNDMWRKLQLLKSFAHENNPWRKFGTGNLATLG